VRPVRPPGEHLEDRERRPEPVQRAAAVSSSYGGDTGSILGIASWSAPILV
jgi:hypothetical protein